MISDRLPQFRAVSASNVRLVTNSMRKIAHIGVFSLIALSIYWPILMGMIPFPSEVVTNFPPWDRLRENYSSTTPHGEMGDLATQFYPWHVFAAESVRRGIVPLWNHQVLLGTPFLAHPQTAVFYPLNTLYIALPTVVAWSLSFPLRTALASTLTYIFVRSLGAPPRTGVVAGTVFSLCGFVTNFQGRPQLDSALWLPLLCYSVERLRRGPSGATLALAGVAFSLPVLAGHPESAAHVVLVGGVYALFRLIWPAGTMVKGRPEAFEFTARFVGVGLLALALASVQLVPTLEWLTQIARTLDHHWGPRPLQEIVAFVSRDLSAPLNRASVAIPEGAAYAGILTLLVAPLSMWHKNRRVPIFFVSLTIVCLQVIYGWGPAYWLSQHVPIIRGIPNWRLLVVVDFSLAVLAALGFSAFERIAAATPKARLFAALVIVLASGVTLGAIAWLHLQTNETAEQAGDWLHGVRGSLLFLVLSTIVLAGCLRWRQHSSVVGWMPVLVLITDLITYSSGHIPFVPREQVFPSAPVFDFLQSRQHAEYRVAAVDVTYGSNFELMYGLSSAGGYDFILARTSRLLEPLSANPEVITFDSRRVVSAPPGLLDMLGVRYLIATTWNDSARLLSSLPERFSVIFSEGSIRVFENRSALPLVFCVGLSGVQLAPDDATQLSQIRDPAFDARQVALVSEWPSHLPIGPTAGMASTYPSELAVKQSINRLDIKVELSSPCLLVISQAYDNGWRVTIDGHGAPLLRVNYGMMGVPVDSGAHAIRLQYLPMSFAIGLAVSLVALLLVLILFTLEIVRHYHGTLRNSKVVAIGQER